MGLGIAYVLQANRVRVSAAAREREKKRKRSDERLKKG
jgi:hypothetical protein